MSLYSALHQYITPAALKAGITADRVVFDWENGVRLQPPFLSMSIDEFAEESSHEVRLGVLNGNDYPEYVDYIATVSVGIDLYGKDVIILAELIKQHFYRNEAYELSCLLKLGFVDLSATTNLTALLAGDYEHRARFVLRVHYGFRYEETIGTIGHVPLYGEVDDWNTTQRVFIDKTVDEP